MKKILSFLSIPSFMNAPEHTARKILKAKKTFSAKAISNFLILYMRKCNGEILVSFYQFHHECTHYSKIQKYNYSAK